MAISSAIQILEKSSTFSIGLVRKAIHGPILPNDPHAVCLLTGDGCAKVRAHTQRGDHLPQSGLPPCHKQALIRHWSTITLPTGWHRREVFGGKTVIGENLKVLEGEWKFVLRMLKGL